MPLKGDSLYEIDPSALLEGLAESGIEFVLVGGLAAVAQGVPMTTLDVDIVHRRTETNIERLLTFLKSVDARQRRPDGKVLRPRKTDLTGKGHLLLRTSRGPLDVLGAIEGGLGFEDLLPHSVKIEFRKHTIYVLGLETLVALKRESKDPEDLIRLAMLEETLRQVRNKKDQP